MKTLNLMKGDTPMRACEALTYEPAACWQRLQQAKHEFFFEDLDQLMKDRHKQFLEELMGYERQCFLNAHPYERSQQRTDQANGFYRRQLTTRLGIMDRLFVEVRRRIRTMCAFTTRSSSERILFSVFDRMNNQWSRHPLHTFTQNS